MRDRSAIGSSQLFLQGTDLVGRHLQNATDRHGNKAVNT